MMNQYQPNSTQKYLFTLLVTFRLIDEFCQQIMNHYFCIFEWIHWLYYFVLYIEAEKWKDQLKQRMIKLLAIYANVV